MSKDGEIETKKLNAMKVKILQAEQDNLRTREKTSEAMVEEIRKIIRTEVQRNY